MKPGDIIIQQKNQVGKILSQNGTTFWVEFPGSGFPEIPVHAENLRLATSQEVYNWLYAFWKRIEEERREKRCK